MDNAGGHGKSESILEYSKYLVEDYNILVPHQVPRFPKTNMLELGAWVTVQSRVKKYHPRNTKQHNYLTHSVNNSWHNVEAQKLTKIWNHFLDVRDLII